MSHTKKLALSGVFAGLTVAVLWVFSLVPYVDYALPAIAGMVTLLLVLEIGRVWSAAVYLAAAVLCNLLLPNKSIALFYAAFFGYYPILKSLLEDKLPKWLAWLCKFAVFNAAMVGAYVLATKLFDMELEDFGETFGKFAKAIMLMVGNAAFAVFDTMVLSTFIVLYNRRWRKKLRRLMR